MRSTSRRLAEDAASLATVNVVYDDRAWHCNRCAKGNSNSRDPGGDARKHNRSAHRGLLIVHHTDS